MKLIVLLSICTLLLIGMTGCTQSENEMEQKKTTEPRRGIMDVQEEYVKSLMSIEGVIGVYIGAKDDGTPCIRVMVKKRTSEINSKIPSQLEGYPVEIEVTGKIEPLDTSQ